MASYLETIDGGNPQEVIVEDPDYIYSTEEH